MDLLREAIVRTHHGHIAVVSSFGAESALLLALVAGIDPGLPVLFLDTGKHFPETLAYRTQLVARLGLTDLRVVQPDAAALARIDPDGTLHRFIPDDCCALRKVAPLEHALAPFDAWISGRKRYQSAGRAVLPLREEVDGRVKLNPLAEWSAAEIAAEIRRRDLPAHPLVARGFPSIGCAPCTRAVGPGEDVRAGRWAGSGKTECGIHRSPASRRPDPQPVFPQPIPASPSATPATGNEP
ncbi:phosphoadenylyl-sulfate reductase [Rhodovastum atsumiense]|uniref:phosphoadenylyl-sulfate reductase n=1 Tax=Rhodovastum atsumiense TaxID=504468 RepID=UPI001EEFFE10|nr:phosphoadenylyl-sulfate reductase [Rhodovastum atsumiense]